jgi:hypothetical protein
MPQDIDKPQRNPSRRSAIDQSGADLPSFIYPSPDRPEAEHPSDILQIREEVAIYAACVEQVGLRSRPRKPGYGGT